MLQYLPPKILHSLHIPLQLLSYFSSSVTAKFLERTIYIHCFYFLSTSLFNNLQSGFCLYHPIKIAPLKVKLTFILSNQMCSILNSHLA